MRRSRNLLDAPALRRRFSARISSGVGVPLDGGLIGCCFCCVGGSGVGHADSGGVGGGGGKGGRGNILIGGNVGGGVDIMNNGIASSNQLITVSHLALYRHL